MICFWGVGFTFMIVNLGDGNLVFYTLLLNILDLACVIWADVYCVGLTIHIHSVFLLLVPDSMGKSLDEMFDVLECPLSVQLCWLGDYSSRRTKVVQRAYRCLRFNSSR